MERPETRVGRRGFLGYVGSAVAGVAVGATAGSVGASARHTPAPEEAAGPVAAARTISPYGVHQPGIAAATAPVTEVVALDLHPHVRDRDALARLLRVWTGDVEALSSGRGAPGDPAPWLAATVADLTVTVGLGPRLLGAGAGWGVPAPPGFGRVPAMRHDRLQERWCGGDLVVVVAGRDGTTVGHAVRRLVADARPFAGQRWRQSGSWNSVGADGRPVTGRNLFGQVDGSGNPRPGTALFDRTVWVPDGPWAGGTTLVVRRIRMDLPTWDGLTRAEQEASVGRRLDDGAPLTGGGELDDVDLAVHGDGRPAVAPDAHVRRSHPSLHGGARIFRKGANYEVAGTGEPEAGLLFQSHQADLLGQYVPIQRSLDESDALNEWTTAIGSAEFALLPGFVPGEWLGQGLLG